MNGIQLRLYDFGYEDPVIDSLLNELRTGSAKYLGATILNSMFGTVRTSLDTRTKEEINDMFPNFLGHSWPLLRTSLGIVDVNFMVSVIATPTKRKRILSHSADETNFYFQTQPDSPGYTLLLLHGEIFNAAELWAATESGHRWWYAHDPNFFSLKNSNTDGPVYLAFRNRKQHTKKQEVSQIAHDGPLLSRLRNTIMRRISCTISSVHCLYVPPSMQWAIWIFVACYFLRIVKNRISNI